MTKATKQGKKGNGGGRRDQPIKCKYTKYKAKLRSNDKKASKAQSSNNNSFASSKLECSKEENDMKKRNISDVDGPNLSPCSYSSVKRLKRNNETTSESNNNNNVDNDKEDKANITSLDNSKKTGKRKNEKPPCLFIADQNHKLCALQTRKKQKIVKQKTYKMFVGTQNTEKKLANEIQHYLGPMELCEYGCGAKHFKNESTKRNCCEQGQGVFKDFHPAHPDILDLLSNEDTKLKDNARLYNSLFQMATLGSTFGGEIIHPDKHPFHFKFSGGIYHSLPPLIPRDDVKAKFVQLYVIDSYENELKERLDTETRKKPNKYLVTKLNEILHASNPFIEKFKTVGSLLQTKKLDEVYLQILGFDHNFRSPSSNELSVFLPDITSESNTFNKYRDIKCRNKNGTTHSIDELNGSYDPLHYPLLFPYGECGFSYMKKRTIDDRYHNTCMNFYQQILQIRDNSHLLHMGRLSKEYIADQWAKIEKMRLDFISTHQKQCRADLYSNVVDFIETRKRNNNDKIQGKKWGISM